MQVYLFQGFAKRMVSANKWAYLNFLTLIILFFPIIELAKTAAKKSLHVIEMTNAS